MEEFVAVTLVGRPGETEAAFKDRLSVFWTGVLRNDLATFEGVYAEAAEFSREGGNAARAYLAVPEAAEALAGHLAAADIGCLPIDPTDTYSKYEATPPDWWQIEH